MPPGWPDHAPRTQEERDAFFELMGVGDRGNHPTSEISEKIDAYRAGHLGEEALVDFLDTYNYTSGEDPDAPERGTSEWYLNHADGGKPYVAGSWDEVRLNASVRLLPQRLYREIHRRAYDRAVRATRNPEAGEAAPE